MKHMGQPLRTWFSLKVFGLAKKHLCQPQNTWISCQKPGTAMEHLGQSQGIWISHETLVSALTQQVLNGQIGSPKSFEFQEFFHRENIDLERSFFSHIYPILTPRNKYRPFLCVGFVS